MISNVRFQGVIRLQEFKVLNKPADYPLEPEKNLVVSLAAGLLNASLGKPLSRTFSAFSIPGDCIVYDGDGSQDAQEYVDKLHVLDAQHGVWETLTRAPGERKAAYNRRKASYEKALQNLYAAFQAKAVPAKVEYTVGSHWMETALRRLEYSVPIGKGLTRTHVYSITETPQSK